MVSTHRRLCQTSLDCVNQFLSGFCRFLQVFARFCSRRQFLLPQRGSKVVDRKKKLKNQYSWYVYVLWPNINRVLLTRPEKSSLTCSVFFREKNPDSWMIWLSPLTCSGWPYLSLIGRYVGMMPYQLGKAANNLACCSSNFLTWCFLWPPEKVQVSGWSCFHK